MGGIAWPARALIVAAVAALATAWFFRFHIAGGFTLFSGDRYDAMIEVAILQHWRNVFDGREAWQTMRYFYPVPGSIGYNDGYLVYGALYAVARDLGFGLIAAADAAHAVVKFAGIVGMYLLLAGPLRCRFGWALAGAAVFGIANVTLQHVNHAQLLTVAFAPYGFVFAWRAVEALVVGDRRRLTAHGVALGATFALWISTAYYLAWFFAFFLVIVAAAYLVRVGRDGRRAAWRQLVASRAPLAVVALATLAMLAPFLWVYLPKALETGTRSMGSIKHSTLSPLEYIDPGIAAGAWSPLFDPLRAALGLKPGWGLKTNPDDIFGFAPLLFVLAVAGIVRWRRDAWLGPVAVALAVAWVLLFRIWVVSPWYAVHLLVPGASALRVAARFQLLLLVPAVALATLLLDRARSRGRALAAAALLLVEQGSATRAPVMLDAHEQQAMIAAVLPPPAWCRAFVVRSTRASAYPAYDLKNDAIYAHNVDAMVLAEVWARPTVNGYSSFNPPGWDFAAPATPDYTARVTRYAARYRLTGLCLLDRRRSPAWAPL